MQQPMHYPWPAPLSLLLFVSLSFCFFFFFQAEDGIRDFHVTGVQTCALPILRIAPRAQLALLVPIVETYRRFPTASDSGGGFGDVNLSARYDFVLAGESTLDRKSVV